MESLNVCHKLAKRSWDESESNQDASELLASETTRERNLPKS